MCSRYANSAKTTGQKQRNGDELLETKLAMEFMVTVLRFPSHSIPGTSRLETQALRRRLTRAKVDPGGTGETCPSGECPTVRLPTFRPSICSLSTYIYLDELHVKKFLGILKKRGRLNFSNYS